MLGPSRPAASNKTQEDSWQQGPGRTTWADRLVCESSRGTPWQLPAEELLDEKARKWQSLNAKRYGEKRKRGTQDLIKPSKAFLSAGPTHHRVTILNAHWHYRKVWRC